MKISDELLNAGRELAEKHGYTELYVNDNGEFFTVKNFAILSVKNDNAKWAKIDLVAVVEKTEKTTTDLQKASEVIAEIEGATDMVIVEAIMKAEAEGKNRKSVIEAGKNKLKVIAERATSPLGEDGKPENVTLQAIETETELTAVAALLELEKLGKNRPEVIEAATKKIETLTKNAQ